MSGVFISYRRDDSAGWTRSVHDRLAQAFGHDRVFLDVDDIAAGADFTDEITRRLREIDVVVVVMGPRWATITGPEGTPRIQDPNDVLRREIAIALLLGVKVLPVLVDGATMPGAEDLPDELLPLARLNAIDLLPQRFNADADTLVATIAPHLSTGQRRHSTALLAGLAVAAVLVAAAIVAVVVSRENSTTTTGPDPVPTAVLTTVPTAIPTAVPTAVPTLPPTAVPTAPPTAVPTLAPTAVPTVEAPSSPALPDPDAGSRYWTETRTQVTIAPSEDFVLDGRDVAEFPPTFAGGCLEAFLVFSWQVRSPWPDGGDDLEIRQPIPQAGGATEITAQGASGVDSMSYCGEATFRNLNLEPVIIEIRYAASFAG